jgi:drug/metabolite transporter (DMT)-like permease
MQSRLFYFYLIFTILSWSVVPAIAKIALNELNNLQLLCYTSMTGTLFLFSVATFKNKLPELKQYSPNDYLKMFGMGFVGIFLYYVFLYGSFSYAPAGQTNVINYLWPVFIIIFSIPILKEKFNSKTLLAILISFLGALVVFTNGDISNFSNEYTSGYLLAALAAMCYGLFSVLGKKLYYDKYVSMSVYYLFATLLIFLTTLTFSYFVVPKLITTILAILFLGAISNGIAFVFWFKALHLGHTHKTANIVFIVPFLALVWTYFLNSEPIEVYSIIGLVLIVLGIFIQLRNKV